jgi:hypothetical protein
MRAYKTSTGPKALFRMFLNKQKIASQNSHGIGQKVPGAAHRKKADSPGQNLEQIGFSLVIFVIALVGIFVFVWYTALKRNL